LYSFNIFHDDRINDQTQERERWHVILLEILHRMEKEKLDRGDKQKKRHSTLQLVHEQTLNISFCAFDSLGNFCLLLSSK